MRDLTTAYIGLGANLGDACAAVLQAAQEIAALDRVVLTRQSSLYASAPVDSHGPDYVNAVVEVQTHLRPHELLVQLQAIETRAGRLRPYRNAPRTLDLDILLFGDVSLDSPELILPHPRMAQRAFVLVPLAEIAPQAVATRQMQAVQGQTIRKLGV